MQLLQNVNILQAHTQTLGKAHHHVCSPSQLLLNNFQENYECATIVLNLIQAFLHTHTHTITHIPIHTHSNAKHRETFKTLLQQLSYQYMQVDSTGQVLDVGWGVQCLLPISPRLYTFSSSSSSSLLLSYTHTYTHTHKYSYSTLYLDMPERHIVELEIFKFVQLFSGGGRSAKRY